MNTIAPLPDQELFAYDSQGHEHHFHVRLEAPDPASSTEFTAYVFQGASWPPPHHAWYEVSFKDVGDELQTVHMDNHDHAHLRRKGIGVALLPLVSRIVGRDIVSSPRLKDFRQRRSDDATCVWTALATLDLASAEGDRFRLHAQRAAAYTARRVSG